MSGRFFLDWAMMALSLFNTILLLWLGLMVLLNAERQPARQARGRRWGIWLAAGGLLTGSAFFVSHSAILGRGLLHVSRGMNLWWQAGWLAVVVLPLAWYLVMLWYAGYWEGGGGSLRRRQRPWFFLVVLLAGGLVALFVFASPLPAYWQMVQLDLGAATPSVWGVPLLLLIYPLYTILCIALSLDVLRSPEPSGRVMGDLARQRARPWLVAASVTMLIVSLLVAWIMLWLVVNARLRVFYVDMALLMAWFDLVISLLIAISVLLLGQAVVSYEIFTGKALPRRGLIRHWRRAVILAVGYGLVVGASLVVQLRAIYGLLLTALLMTLFYALLGWRSYAERERFIDHLRPFVASQRLYERLLTPSGSAMGDVDVTALFRALCQDVLGVRSAYLIPLGPSTPFFGAALAFPAADSPPPPLSGVVSQFVSPQSMCLPLDPASDRAAMWAVPLWSERGLIGALLLGEKRDGGLYTQEEIEIARASGERLMDALVGAEMARRLMALQRQRLAESQVLDQKTRRTLHDDVLPLLHTALLSLGGEGGSSAASLLADAHRQISDLLHEMPSPAAPELARLGLIGALRRVVDDELAGDFGDIVWQIAPEAERELRAIPSLTTEVLFYAAREAIRNAARHGRDGDNSLNLRVVVTCCQPGPNSGQGGLEILVEDDGLGFGPVDSATDPGGQGLALHSTMMAVVGGTLAVDSLPGVRTRVRLTLPSSIWRDKDILDT